MLIRNTTLAFAALALGLASCTSASRTIGKVTANKYAESRSGSVWIVAPPELEPVSGNRKTVYISFRNISDAQDIDLLGDIKNAAQASGWRVVNDPDGAQYRLRGTLRFFGEVEPESGGASVRLGSIAGAAVSGYAAAAAANAVFDNNSAGYVAGGVVGALAAAGIQNASRPREWALITDFVLEEYSSRPVTFEMATQSGSTRSSGGGAGNARTAIGGGQSSSNSSVATATRTSNYFPHGIRVSAWANQMNMSEEEALPLIEARIERAVTDLLPI